MAKKPPMKKTSMSDLRAKFGRPDTEFLPTGVMVLDDLWGGGIPSGKIIELHSQAGLGKCVVEGTRVLTNVGYQKIEALGRFTDGVEIADTDVEGAHFQALGRVRVHDHTRASHLYYGSEQETHSIKSPQITLTGTAAHRVKVFDPEKGIIWKHLPEVEPGDILPAPLKNDVIFNNPIPPSAHFQMIFPEDRGWLLGVLVSMGYMEGKSFKVQLPVAFAESLMLSLDCQWETETNLTEGEMTLSTSDRFFIEDLHHNIGIISDGKTVIPEWVYSSNHEFLSGFLAGIFDTSFNIARCQLMFDDYDLMFEVRSLLNIFGIYPASGAIPIPETVDVDYMLQIGPVFWPDLRFISCRDLEVQECLSQWDSYANRSFPIPYCQPWAVLLEKANILLEEGVIHSILEEYYSDGYIESGTFRTIVDPYIGNPKSDQKTVSDLREILSYQFLHITHSEPAGVQRVWDLTVPDTHTFLAGGVLNHNTTMALQIAKMHMKKGKKVGFMDVEGALEKSLKDSMGISEYEEQTDGDENPMFAHLTCSFYSEVEETTDALLNAGYDLIIFDSLTMAVPDRYKDVSIITEAPGLKARLQAKYLEQFKVPLARSGATMLILNQMRMSLEGFRPQLKPAGGYALQFETDIRTGLRRTKWLDEGTGDEKERVGCELEITTIKNKLTIPFRTATVVLNFGKGINNLASLAQILIQREVVSQNGAYFTVPGEDKNLRGKEAYHGWIRSNKDLCIELLKGDTTTHFEAGDDSED